MPVAATCPMARPNSITPSVRPPLAAATTITLSEATSAVTSTMTMRQNCIVAISSRRSVSSTRKAEVAKPKASASTGERNPVSSVITTPATPVAKARMPSHHCNAARTDGRPRSSTVSESPTKPLHTAVASTIIPNRTANFPRPSRPRYRAVANCSAKLANACEPCAAIPPKAWAWSRAPARLRRPGSVASDRAGCSPARSGVTSAWRPRACASPITALRTE